MTATETQIAIIRKGRGILKCQPGDKLFAEEWAQHRREEIHFEQQRREGAKVNDIDLKGTPKRVP